CEVHRDHQGRPYEAHCACLHDSGAGNRDQMMTRVALILAAAAVGYAADRPKSWASDNGNGFANVNRFGLQVFRATGPRGPWNHNRIEKGLHDLSVLFD